MILEKVIEDKIKEKVEISPEEIVEFYKAYNAENKREIQEKQLLMENYMESIAAIEEENERATEMIDQLREDKKDKYRNKFSQDREQLIKDIETKFGIQYVP